MKKILAFTIGMVAINLTACATMGEKQPQQFSGRLTLTGGFDFSTMRGMDKKGSKLEGDELLASFNLPSGTWTRISRQPTEKSGYIELYAPNQYGLHIEWLWLDDINKRQRLERMPALAPWYTGVRDTTYQRIPYTPTKQQLESGDWYQSGYSKDIWRQYHLLGKKHFYCLTSLSTRNNNTQWNAEHGIPIVNSYEYIYLCPFRFTDNRDGDFIIRTGFSTQSTSQQDNQALIDNKIAEIDQQLKPIWDSLEVNPKAYQFSQ